MGPLSLISALGGTINCWPITLPFMGLFSNSNEWPTTPIAEELVSIVNGGTCRSARGVLECTPGPIERVTSSRQGLLILLG